MLRENAIVALKIGDIKVYADRVVITIQYSKTNPVPVEITLFKRDDLLCPVRAVTQWMMLRQQFLPKNANKLLFWTIKGKLASPLSASALDNKFKQLVKLVLGLDPADYSIHTLRRSGCTALHQAGVSDATLKAMGRWASLAFLRYIVITLDSIEFAQAAIKV